MATITAAGSGNWSTGATWTGGTVPGNGDVADLNGQTVTMDIATIPASGTLLGITAAGNAGVLVLGGVAGANVVNATNLTAGTVGSAGTFQYSGATCDSLTINGNIVGCAAGGTNPAALVKSSTKALIIVGNLTGGGVSNAKALIISTAAGNVTVTGNVTAGSTTGTYGITGVASAVLAVTGTVTGGTGSLTSGIYTAAVMTITITGNIVAGSGWRCSGLEVNANFKPTLNTCNMTNTTNAIAYSGPEPTWTPAATNYIGLSGGTKLAPEVAATNLKDGIWNGTVEGTMVAGYTVNGIACA